MSARWFREINGTLLETFVALADPIHAMEVVVPVSFTVGTGQGDDHQRLQYFLFGTSGFLFVSVTLYFKFSLNRTSHFL